MFFLQLLFIIPFNFCFSYYALKLSTAAYIFVIIYSIICGVCLCLMDFSNKIVNLVFSVIYLVFNIIILQNAFFDFGATAYLFVLIFGYLITVTIKTIREK